MVDIQHYNLSQFCATAAELLEDEARHEQFVRFMLSGMLETTQAVVTPSFNRLRRRDEIIIERDFDSLLGISNEIEFNTAITVFPVARRQDTLTRNVHLTHQIRTVEVSSISLSIDLMLILSRVTKTSLYTPYPTLRLGGLEFTPLFASSYPLCIPEVVNQLLLRKKWRSFTTTASAPL